MNLKKIVMLALLIVGISSIYSFDREDCINVLENGELKTLEGVLSSKDGMTFITVGRDSYEVLRGPGMFTYKDGDKLTLEGLVFEMQIMPRKVKIGGVEILLGRKGRGRGCLSKWDRDKGPRNEKRDGRNRG